MKGIKIFIIIFISMIVFTENAKAVLPLANTYKQGIYNITESNQSNYVAKLVTPNNITTLIILDSDGDQKFFKKFNTVNEPINLGPMTKGDTVIVIGTGEIAASFVK
ncbi:hypothetical protein [Clostridium beijerinckii]|jgi:hypothetical protein|uniref:Uncharacterized protein n=1 Tax=Clostridium beijerinckii TaxID=1520 RepID=A0A1S9N9U0_CLOBE|nr:hypothetical protein [Clostridium beijerinckii]MDK2829272.1 hypothetical protein [Clostridium butyricum]OOP74314.1 hypothetical protein CBEIBR21_07430 [Clostridium beijerinckii]